MSERLVSSEVNVREAWARIEYLAADLAEKKKELERLEAASAAWRVTATEAERRAAELEARLAEADQVIAEDATDSPDWYAALERHRARKAKAPPTEGTE